MEVLLKACASGELPAHTVFVGSDKETAKGLATAHNLGAETKFFSYKSGRRAAEEAIAKAVRENNIEWIVLAGYMRILSPEFVHEFAGKIINIHPALLPAFPGAHGIQDAWEAGVSTTGVTVHIVDEEVDHGPILAQEEVKRLDGDTIEDLEARIHKTEHRIYKAALKNFFEARNKK